MSLALFSLPGKAPADPNDVRTLVLSNELGAVVGGGLIDRLIAAGYGSQNLYQILQFLAAQLGSGIPADFVTSVANNPAGSEVFTAPLNNFAGLNGPVGINADGTFSIHPIFGRDYNGLVGFVTNNVLYPGIAPANFTMATSPIYYIDAGERPGNGRYQAIGIAWTKAARTFMLSNEAPGYLIDKLIAAGHGSENLYQVLQFLAAQPGNGIPADFVAEVGNSPSGSDVFTAALSNFSSAYNNPIGINADGNLIVAQILGRDYDGHTGFVTNTIQYFGIGSAKVTLATSPIYYIDAGSNVTASGTTYYTAFGIAWAGGIRLYLPLIIR
ncbi:MAG: hypothetical protein HY892_14610 [Deltaproteobacteria bacterium]|nr:hypothetical protein [Deltaproteobacteria bacterium]